MALSMVGQSSLVLAFHESLIVMTGVDIMLSSPLTMVKMAGVSSSRFSQGVIARSPTQPLLSPGKNSTCSLPIGIDNNQAPREHKTKGVADADQGLKVVSKT